jgi:hypothetical protein
MSLRVSERQLTDSLCAFVDLYDLLVGCASKLLRLGEVSVPNPLRPVAVLDTSSVCQLSV